MGPRLFSRGNCPAGPGIRCPRKRFNGATAFQPWKCAGSYTDQDDIDALQWGHGFSAVEMNKWADEADAACKLQWGHGFSAVEISMSISLSLSAMALQWGHGFSAVEIAATSGW